MVSLRPSEKRPLKAAMHVFQLWPFRWGATSTQTHIRVLPAVISAGGMLRAWHISVVEIFQACNLKVLLIS